MDENSGCLVCRGRSVNLYFLLFCTEVVFIYLFIFCIVSVYSSKTCDLCRGGMLNTELSVCV